MALFTCWVRMMFPCPSQIGSGLERTRLIRLEHFVSQTAFLLRPSSSTGCKCRSDSSSSSSRPGHDVGSLFLTILQPVEWEAAGNAALFSLGFHGRFSPITANPALRAAFRAVDKLIQSIHRAAQGEQLLD